MKKQLNLNFCENLIFSDFFLIQAPKKSLKLNRSVSLKRQNYFLLNIFKQFLGVYTRSRKNMPRFLFLNTDDLDYAQLITNFFDEFIDGATVENVSDRDLTEQLMFTGTPSKQFLISFTDLTNPRNPIDFFYYKLFLINVMNIRSNNSTQQTSFYGINNKIDTNRKIFLILSIIENTIRACLPPFKFSASKDNRSENNDSTNSRV